MEFILASGSPRRRQLLEQIGLRGFAVRPTDADESLPEGIDPEWPGVTNGYYPQQRTVVGGLEISF